MKIKIDDGVPTVEFRITEAKALRQVVGICTNLGQWLKDDQATLVAEALTQVVARYPAASLSEEEVPA